MKAECCPLVSVLMPFYNAEQTVAYAIKSILWQSYDNWELILINDGSTDNSINVIAKFDDKRIILINSNERKRLARRLNQGVLLAKGRYIVRMDADDVSFPERFAKQVEFLLNNPEVDVVATSALIIDENFCPQGIYEVGLTHEQICKHPYLGFPMQHPTWMGKKEWFETNPYDEMIELGQDQSLLYQCYKKSTFAGISDVLIGYRYSKVACEKSFKGRRAFLQTILKQRDYLNFTFALPLQSMAFIRDFFAVLTNKHKLIVKNRTTPVNNDVLQKWNSLVNKLETAV